MKADQMTAHRRLYAELRAMLEKGRLREGERMPTEMELSQEHGISRQTVRRAFQDLVSEGLVYRVPGRGTFATGLSSDQTLYVSSAGAVEDLFAWENTSMEVLSPVSLRNHEQAAVLLELPTTVVATVTVRRLCDGVPFVLTHSYLPPELGQLLIEVEALPAEGPGTVVGALEQSTPHRITRATQSITPVLATPGTAEHIDCQAEEPVLRVERLYFDSGNVPVLWCVSYHNPERSTHRLELRRTSL